MEFKFKPLEREPIILPEENEEEIWKQSISFPLYEVSSFGRLRRISTGYILNPRMNNGGYKEVIIPVVCGGKRKTVKIHRLIAEIFCEGYNEENDCVYIDHIDHCNYNNYYKNLRYVTKAENFQNMSVSKRELISRTNEPVALIDKVTNEVIETFASIREASKKTGLSEANISYVIHGTRKPFRIGYFVLARDLT